MLRPKAFDLVAHYEPRADFAVSPGVRRTLAELAHEHSGRTLMMGRHSGRPELHTDIKGISVATRIELSRLVLRQAARRAALTGALRLFVEAARRRVASGPIQRILFYSHHADRRAEVRAPVREAFRAVFDDECRFLTGPQGTLEMGHAVVHQTLLEHLREDGPYQSEELPRIEAVQVELQRLPGRYEGHRLFGELVPCDDGRTRLRFCYSGERPDPIVETSMRHKTDERLRFVEREEVDRRPKVFVSLADYERGARRYGTLWVLQDDLVRPLDRHRAAVLYLFLDDGGRADPARRSTWQELFERQRECPQIGRASRNSSTYLDITLRQLVDSGFVVWARDGYALHPAIESYKHATFYELGSYHKRLS